MAVVEASAREPVRFPFGFALGIILGVYLALLAFTFRETLTGTAPKVEAQPSPPPIVTQAEAITTAPVERIIPIAKETLNVNLGPSSAYGVIGTLPKAALIEMISGERSGDWVAIRFPPNSSGRGWIPADGIEQVVRGEEAAAGAASARPERVGEIMSAWNETAADAQTSAPTTKLGQREIALLTGASAVVMALLFAGFVLRQRMSRVRFAGASKARLEVGLYPVMSQQIETDQALSEVETAAEQPETKESALNIEMSQESSQSRISPDEVLRRGLSEFSQTLQSLTTSVTTALEKLGGDFRDALGSIAEEQRAALQRQEALLEETQRATSEARNYAEQASAAASQTTSNQERATELLANLQKDRDGLTVLVGDLRSRIAALSILAAPLPEASQGQHESVAVPAGSEQHGEWAQ